MQTAHALPPPPYFDELVWGHETWGLLSAAFTGDVETVTRLLDEDPARIQAQFAYYEPLHYAVRGGHVAMVKLLLQRGAHPKAEGWGGRLGDETPIAKAADRERADLVELLKQAAAVMPAYAWPAEKAEEKLQSPEQQLKAEFVHACHKGNCGRVEGILAMRPDLATDGLYEAVHQGHADIVRLLLAAGADVGAHMPWACWFTPLMHSLRYRLPRWTIAEMLFERGLSVDATNGLGMTALHIVVLQGTTDAAQWLLDRGADINRIDPEFCSTPLGWAARWGRPEMAKLLLARGALVGLPREDAWAQPVRWAEKKGLKDMMRLLS